MILFSSWFNEGTNNAGTANLAQSTDGVTWNSFGSWVYSGTAVGLRDTSLTCLSGTYYIAYTNVNPNNFGLASSTSINSSFVDCPNVSCATLATGTASNCWAPEWFSDPTTGQTHIIIAISTSGAAGFNIYELHPSVAGSLSGAWSNPALLTILNSNGSIFDPTSNYMVDPFCFYYAGNYHLFGVYFGFGPFPTFWHAINTSGNLVTGTFTISDLGFSGNAGFPTGIEGPAFYNRQGTWWCYMDHSLGNLNTHQIQYSTTTVNPPGLFGTWTGWSTPVNIVTPQISSPGQGTPYLNGAEVIGTNTYIYPTGTDSTGYLPGLTAIGPTASVPAGGVISSPNNLTGFKGDGVARLGKG